MPFNPDLYKPVLVLAVEPNSTSRATAYREIGDLGEGGQPAIPILLASARIIVANTGPTTAPKGLRGIKRTGMEAYLLEADIIALGRIASDELAVVKTIVEFTKFRDNRFDAGLVRWAAVQALGNMGVRHQGLRKGFVPHLLRSTADPEPRARLASIEILGKFGPDAKDAIQVLKTLKLDPMESVRSAAAAALKKIENP